MFEICIIVLIALIQFDRTQVKEYKYGKQFSDIAIKFIKMWKILISFFFSRHFSLRRGFRYIFRQLPTDSSSRATHVHTRTHTRTRIYILHLCVYAHPIPALNASATIRIGNCAVCTATVTSNTSR